MDLPVVMAPEIPADVNREERIKLVTRITVTTSPDHRLVGAPASFTAWPCKHTFAHGEVREYTKKFAQHNTNIEEEPHEKKWVDKRNEDIANICVAAGIRVEEIGSIAVVIGVME